MSPKKMQFKNRLEDLQAEELSVSADFFQSNTPAGAEITSGQHAGEDVWMASPDGYDGQLAVDVYHDQTNVYVRAIVGGIDPKDIEVHLNNDMVTIKGKRIAPTAIKPENYFIQECYWGGFSRSIILPLDIRNDSVEAKIEHGILLITLQKSNRPKNTRIPIKAA
jgi:HSP20 family protein